jgi:hypothetical protein
MLFEIRCKVDVTWNFKGQLIIIFWKTFEITEKLREQEIIVIMTYNPEYLNIDIAKK